MNKKEQLENIKESYYTIFLTFKVTRDVLNEVEDDNIIEARNILYKKLNSLVPEQEYDVYSSTVMAYPTDDDYNYLIIYSSFIKGDDKLPFDGYVSTKEVVESIKNEFMAFFDSISLDYKLVNIKPLV